MTTTTWTCAKCGWPMEGQGSLDPRGAIDGKPSYMHDACARETAQRIAAERHQRKQRLADAAPCLLAALKQARMVMSTEGENDVEEWNDVLATIEAAIAEAEGAS